MPEIGKRLFVCVLHCALAALTMKIILTPWLFWTPRILSVLFAAFIAMFALDVFGEGHSFWGTALALVMHLIPALLVVATLLAAWRWEPVGGILFVALGIAYLVTAWGRFHWSAYVVISGPLFLLGVLFVIDWLYRSRHRTTAGT